MFVAYSHRKDHVEPSKGVSGLWSAADGDTLRCDTGCCKDEYGAFVSYKTLKTYYEDHATRMRDAQTLEDVHERNRRRTACVKCYLLYLVGCLLFGDKSNKRIELIYLTTMNDYARMRDYSWGGMTLAYLYHWLYEVSLPNGKALGGCITLLMVINCVTLFNLNIFFCFFLGNNL
jgi:hypothetical protein